MLINILLTLLSSKVTLGQALDNINLPMLQELDLSGLSNVDAAYFFQGGVYNKANDIGLKNIKKLNLNKVKH